MLVIEHGCFDALPKWYFAYLQIKRKILSAQDSVKQFIFGPKGGPSGKEQSDNAK